MFCSFCLFVLKFICHVPRYKAVPSTKNKAGCWLVGQTEREGIRRIRCHHLSKLPKNTVSVYERVPKITATVGILLEWCRAEQLRDLLLYRHKEISRGKWVEKCAISKKFFILETNFFLFFPFFFVIWNFIIGWECLMNLDIAFLFFLFSAFLFSYKLTWKWKQCFQMAFFFKYQCKGYCI